MSFACKVPPEFKLAASKYPLFYLSLIITVQRLRLLMKRQSRRKGVPNPRPYTSVYIRTRRRRFVRWHSKMKTLSSCSLLGQFTPLFVYLLSASTKKLFMFAIYLLSTSSLTRQLPFSVSCRSPKVRTIPLILGTWPLLLLQLIESASYFRYSTSFSPSVGRICLLFLLLALFFYSSG